MAQFSTIRNSLLPWNDDLYEVVMVSGQAGPSIYVDAGNLNTSSDAFGRQRVSEPQTLFESTNINYKNEKFNEELHSGGICTYDSDRSEVVLSVGVDSGDEVIRQSNRHFAYQAGKSLLVMNTFVFDEPKANMRQRVGYFDSDNGIYLQQDDSDISMVLRKSINGTVEETVVPRASWNVNTLDGTDPALANLDLKQSQIMWTDIEWLGVGSVRTGFVIGGQLIPCHIFHNANVNNSVYMRTANLPIRYEIANTGSTVDSSSLKQICSTVISEGGYEPRAEERIAGTTSLNGVAVDTAFENLVTIRMNTPGSIVVPAGADILNVANTDFEWALFKNATPSSAFTFTKSTNRVDVALDTITFSDTGTRVAGGYMGGKTAPVSLGGDGVLSWDNQLGETINNVSDTFTLAIRASSNSSNAAGILRWYEL